MKRKATTMNAQITRRRYVVPHLNVSTTNWRSWGPVLGLYSSPFPPPFRLWSSCPRLATLRYSSSSDRAYREDRSAVSKGTLRAGTALDLRFLISTQMSCKNVGALGSESMTGAFVDQSAVSIVAAGCTHLSFKSATICV